MGWMVVAWRRKGLVAACAFLAGGVAWGVSLLLPRQYAAQAGIAYTHLRARNASDDATAPREDGRARQRALMALVRDPGVAKQVLECCGADLDPRYRDSSALLRSVEVDDSHGEVFFITVSTRDAELSASLANAWAECYVAKANAVFGATTCPELCRTLEQEVARQGKAYEEAQKALVAFLEKSDEPSLRADSEYHQLLLRNFVDQHAQEHREALAEAHRAERERGNPSPSLWAELCDAGLRAQGFPTELLEKTAPSQRHSDLASKRPAINPISSVRFSSIPTQADQERALVNRDAARLEARIAEVSAEREALTTARDTAFQLWSALRHRKAETEIASRMVGAEVRLVLPAVPPDGATSPRPLECGALGALLGAIAVVLVLTAADASRRSLG